MPVSFRLLVLGVPVGEVGLRGLLGGLHGLLGGLHGLLGELALGVALPVTVLLAIEALCPCPQRALVLLAFFRHRTCWVTGSRA